MHDEATQFFAKFHLYESMAHYVAKVLHQRPNDILDNWGVPELIVAFGEYANEETKRNYEEWKHLDAKQRASVQRPSEYAVKFHDIKVDFEE